MSDSTLYAIKAMKRMPDGDFLVKVSLDPPADLTILVFKLAEDIEHSESNEHQMKEYVSAFLFKNNRFALREMIKRALRDPAVVRQLEQKQNGIFRVDYDGWLSLMAYVKEDEENKRLNKLKDIIAEFL